MAGLFKDVVAMKTDCSERTESIDLNKFYE
jgi:hypothetical protein